MPSPKNPKASDALQIDAKRRELEGLRSRLVDRTNELDSQAVELVARRTELDKQAEGLSEVQTRLGHLPPDQGRMLVRLIGMRESGKSAADSPVRIVESPLTDTVGEFSCRWRHIERDEIRLGEICLADWGDVVIGPKDLEVFRQLA